MNLWVDCGFVWTCKYACKIGFHDKRLIVDYKVLFNIKFYQLSTTSASTSVEYFIEKDVILQMTSSYPPTSW